MKRQMVKELGFGKAAKASSAEVTEPFLPSKEAKSREKQARPMVSSLVGGLT